MVKVLITGGTGLIGKHLQNTLIKNNFKVVVLTRNPKKDNEFRWSIDENYIDENALKDVTHIIHLAGAGIADKRWILKRKKELIDSRVKSTCLLLKKVTEYQIPLRGFISASGIGYYGAVTSDKIYTEEDAPKNDFISTICVQWEKATLQFEKANIPHTVLRTGVVLTKKNGALSKMNTPLFLSALGTGRQYIPWIHIDDLCNLYLEAVNNPNFIGIYNAVAPEHQTNESFIKTLGSIIKKPVLPMNAPSFILKTALGEMAYMLLNGSRVSAQKTNQFYNFVYPDLNSALKNIYNEQQT